MKLALMSLTLFFSLFQFFAYGADHDFSVANDVLIYVGDGIGDPQSLEARILALNPPDNASQMVRDAYTAGRTGLFDLLHNAQHGKEMSWTAPQTLSVNFRQIIESQYTKKDDYSLLLEYLTFRYLSRNYLGFVDAIPGTSEELAARSEADLVSELDPIFSSSSNIKAVSSWGVIKRCALDVNSSVSGWGSLSGRPLTPLPFYRASRYLQGTL